jgi:hypothetical protein
MASMPGTIGFLIFEVTLFALASLAHGGRLMDGYEHSRAAIAEAVVASVLGLGFIISLARPDLARRTAMAVQLFAILGVLVGLVTIVMGVGPQTRADLALHGIMLLTLVIGFLVALKGR